MGENNTFLRGKYYITEDIRFSQINIYYKIIPIRIRRSLLLFFETLQNDSKIYLEEWTDKDHYGIFFLNKLMRRNKLNYVPQLQQLKPAC